MNGVDLGQTIDEWRDIQPPEGDSEKVKIQNSKILFSLKHTFKQTFRAFSAIFSAVVFRRHLLLLDCFNPSFMYKISYYLVHSLTTLHQFLKKKTVLPDEFSISYFLIVWDRRQREFFG